MDCLQKAGKIHPEPGHCILIQTFVSPFYCLFGMEPGYYKYNIYSMCNNAIAISSYL